MTKGILQPALRQYRNNNDSDDFVIGFDKEMVEAVVDDLFDRIIALERMLERALIKQGE